MLVDIAKTIGDSFLPQMDTAIPLLIEALGGRTWEGKESLLEALVIISVECKVYFTPEKKSVLDEITQVRALIFLELDEMD